MGKRLRDAIDPVPRIYGELAVPADVASSAGYYVVASRPHNIIIYLKKGALVLSAPIPFIHLGVTEPERCDITPRGLPGDQARLLALIQGQHDAMPSSTEGYLSA
jgi:hypothetical protein